MLKRKPRDVALGLITEIPGAGTHEKISTLGHAWNFVLMNEGCCFHHPVHLFHGKNTEVAPPFGTTVPFDAEHRAPQPEPVCQSLPLRALA